MSFGGPLFSRNAGAFIDERNDNTSANRPFGLPDTDLTPPLHGPKNTDLMYNGFNGPNQARLPREKG